MGGSASDVEVSIGDRIEGARINTCLHRFNGEKLDLTVKVRSYARLYDKRTILFLFYRRGPTFLIMNLPNLLTLSRIAFLFAIVPLLAFDDIPFGSTIALFLFGIAALSDWADGYVARRMNIVTDFGKLMDALTDKILMVGLFVTLTVLDYFDPWTLVALFCLLLILCREFFITGLRLVATAQGVVLAAEKAGKQKMVSQILAMILLLVAVAIKKDFVPYFGDGLGDFARLLHRVGFFFFLVATYLTASSGLRYVVKYRYLFTAAVISDVGEESDEG